jgi:acyl-CoA synthetase (NDP forming)
MDRFFEPQSVVLFGASANPSKGGNQVLRNFKQYMVGHNYKDLFIVHPRATEIEGVRCFKKLEEISFEGRIDLAVLVIPVSAVMNVVRECIKINVRGILIESGNLSNNDHESKEFAEELQASIKDRDIRIVGPNSIGFNVPDSRYCTPIKHYDQFLETRERNVSICGQSGLFVTGFVEWYFDRSQPFGIAKMAAIGNKIDVNECDILEYYLQDNKTHVIGMYLEDIRDGKRFLSLLKTNQKTTKKPIVLLKSGKSKLGKRAISSHTGSLAGEYNMIMTIAKQFGMFLVDTYEELFLLLALVCRYPNLNSTNIKSKNIGVISISGSGCVLCADFAEKYGLNLPELSDETKLKIRPIFPDWAPIHNPIDTWASIEKVGPQISFNKILDHFLDSKQYDAILLMTISSSFAEFDWYHIVEKMKEYPNIPIIMHFFGGETIKSHTQKARNRDIPVIPSIDFIFKFLAQMAEYSRSRGS